MSRTRSAQRAHMMRGMHAAHYPLVVRQGMRPVGYGNAAAAFPVPEITLGATDANTSGAVSLAATALAKWANGVEGRGLFGYPEIADISIARDSGTFTQDFFDAVKKFQKAKGLKVDGIIGTNTWKALSGSSAGTSAGPSAGTGGGGGGGGGAGGKRTPSSLDTDRGGGSITDKAWFWPVAILVPTAAVIGGILFWPKKKAQ